MIQGLKKRLGVLISIAVIFFIVLYICDDMIYLPSVRPEVIIQYGQKTSHMGYTAPPTAYEWEGQALESNICTWNEEPPVIGKQLSDTGWIELQNTAETDKVQIFVWPDQTLAFPPGELKADKIMESSVPLEFTREYNAIKNMTTIPVVIEYGKIYCIRVERGINWAEYGISLYG
ncbi:MAG: hypothetical protein ACOX81_10425 [Candidatus Heteroscillospira sp.]|jgi:hypothetical protein